VSELIDLTNEAPGKCVTPDSEEPSVSNADLEGLAGPSFPPAPLAPGNNNEKALLRSLVWPGRLVRDYPRASVAAILTVASAVFGLYLLPGSTAFAATAVDIDFIAIQTSPQVPTYLGFVADGERSATVVAGFDVHANETVQWTIYFLWNKADRLKIGNEASGNVVGTLKGAGLGGGEQFGSTNGVISSPTDSDQQLQHGWNSFIESADVQKVMIGNQAMPGLVTIPFRTAGPDGFLRYSGYDMTTNLPALSDYPPSNEFTSEDVVNAPGIENVTGGPQVQQGGEWSWLNSGATAQTSATGTNEAARQASDTRNFYAAVAFGVSGAAFAAFAVEFVGALREDDEPVARKRGPKSPARDLTW
jgi:hypothetical protein